jgi:DNA oxidative demethylase
MRFFIYRSRRYTSCRSKHGCMQTLFSIDPGLPPGFSYFPSFLSEEEEQRLAHAVPGMELHPMVFRGFEAKRRVQSFGYDYNFDKRQLQKGKPVPGDFRFLITKVADFLALDTDSFAELLVTEYPEGSVINWHRDAPPFGIIAGVSLLADCRFRLRPYDKGKQGKRSVITVPVQRRSLYVIRDEARTAWEHSILPVKSRRLSVTLRTLDRAGVV